MNDATAALRPFVEARDLSELALRDALTGQVECYLELDQLEKAQSVVQEGLRIFGSSDIDFSGFAEVIQDRRAAHE